jgi:hypothetical protein
MNFISRQFLIILFFASSFHIEAFSIEGIKVSHNLAKTSVFARLTEDKKTSYDFPFDSLDEIKATTEEVEIEIIATPKDSKCFQVYFSSPYNAIIIFNLLNNNSNNSNKITSIKIRSDQLVCPEGLKKILKKIIQITTINYLEPLSIQDDLDKSEEENLDEPEETENILDSLTAIFSDQARPASPIPASFNFIKLNPNIFFSTILNILKTEDKALFSVDAARRTPEDKPSTPVIIIKKITRPDEKLYKCDSCTYETTYSSALTRHKMTHTGEQLCKCNICEKAFITLYNLKLHKMRHDVEKNYKCDACKKSFINTSDLARHKMIHASKKPYNCDICPYETAYSSALTRHMMIHSGERPFKCDVCDKSFISSYDLIKHKRKHDIRNSHKCDTCEKSFINSSGLIKHQVIHTGEKPYKCSICTYKTFYSSALTRHLKIHTQAHEKANLLKRPREDD